jgi:CHAT domain-containing protein
MPNHIQLVEYAVVDDKLLIWLISKTSIKSQSVKISRAELTNRVKQYLEIISQPPGKVDRLWQELSVELSDLLVRPIEGFLDRQKQICIIPDKILCRLPFGTLVLRGSETRESDKLLVEEFQLLYASSANMFLNLSEKAGQKLSVKEERLLAVGNPDFFQDDFQHLSTLPSADREAVSVAAYYKSPILLVKNQARKKAVIREMERADVVHLALHYDTDAWSPMLSKIPMASAAPGDPEKALYMYELYRYKSLQARLVVLSACQTNAEEYLGGEGAIGISRSFKTIGIPLVIASLWPVDTDATADLMIEFHRNRKQERLLTIGALRTAQQTFFSRKDKYSHPYYWAAFVALGGYSQY